MRMHVKDDFFIDTIQYYKEAHLWEIPAWIEISNRVRWFKEFEGLFLKCTPFKLQDEAWLFDSVSFWIARSSSLSWRTNKINCLRNLGYFTAEKFWKSVTRLSIKKTWHIVEKKLNMSFKHVGLWVKTWHVLLYTQTPGRKFYMNYSIRAWRSDSIWGSPCTHLLKLNFYKS